MAMVFSAIYQEDAERTIPVVRNWLFFGLCKSTSLFCVEFGTGVWMLTGASVVEFF